MNVSKLQWTVYLNEFEVKQGGLAPRHRVETVALALTGFFAQLGKKINAEKNCSLFDKPQKGIRLLIILSNDREALKKYFKQLLSIAYSDKKTDFAKQQRYLLVETGGAPDRLFDALSLIFESLNIGRRVKAWNLLPALELLNEERQSIGRLRDRIEEICFASGVEEVSEFLTRDQNLIHDIFSHIEDKKKSAARLIIGAYLAGEMKFELMTDILREFIKKGEEITEIGTVLQQFDATVSQLKGEVEETFRNPLWKYIEGRKILLIEDQMGATGEGWDAVLPAIFLSEDSYEAIKNGKNPHDIFSTLVNGSGFPLKLKHCSTIDEVLRRDREDENFNFKEFDIILLDLYSSESHPEITLPANVKSPMRSLFERLDNLYKEQIIPEPVPQAIIFSQDSSGITTRTMLNEFKAADYFFKSSQHETHKSGYYSSFRNAIITALKENVLHVTALTAREDRRKFDRWLRQFDPWDRPTILHLMKHFKYFSASSIVEMFNIYFSEKKKMKWKKKVGKVSILGSNFRKPNRFIFSYLGRPNKSGPATVPLLSKTDWFQEFRRKIDETIKPDRKNYPKFLSYDDLQQELIADILIKDVNEDHMCLIFVDDCIMSGGQIKKYIPKFVNEHLKEVCQSIFSKSSKNEDIWTRLKRAFEKKDGRASLEIHIVFAVGVKNKDIKKLIKPKTLAKNSKHENIRCVKGKFTFTPEPLPNDGNGDGKAKKFKDIPIQATVHIANFTKSVQEILGTKEELEKLKEILLKYSVITTKLRSEDHACEFEPIGWEENGGLTTTYANAQGNTIPVVWRDFSDEDILKSEDYPEPQIKRWEGLYTRYFNPLTPKENITKDKKFQEKKEKLPCFKEKKKGKGRKCVLNPYNWNEETILTDEYWKNKDALPPCKLRQNEKKNS